jgi:uncharacterized membrane protein
MGRSTLADGACEHRWWKVTDGPSYRAPIPAAVADLHDRFQRHMFYVALALGCHQRHDRSFSCRGRQIPLCARCLGMLIGPLFAPLYFSFPNPWIAVTCISVFLIDASTQLIGMRESNNWLRLLTGVVFSASVLFLLIHGVTLCLPNTRH